MKSLFEMLVDSMYQRLVVKAARTRIVLAREDCERFLSTIYCLVGSEEGEDLFYNKDLTKYMVPSQLTCLVPPRKVFLDSTRYRVFKNLMKDVSIDESKVMKLAEYNDFIYNLYNQMKKKAPESSTSLADLCKFEDWNDVNFVCNGLIVDKATKTVPVELLGYICTMCKSNYATYDLQDYVDEMFTDIRVAILNSNSVSKVTKE